MKYGFRFGGLCLLGLLLCGCFPVALHPHYLERDVVFDPALVGVWSDKDDDTTETTTITRDGEDGYLYRWDRSSTEDSPAATTVCRARLFRLGNHRFLDLAPIPDPSASARPQTFPLIEGHIVLRIFKTSSGPEMVPMNLDWLEKYLADRPGALRHERIREEYFVRGTKHHRDDLILTGSTLQLRGFLRSMGGDPGLFPPPGAETEPSRPSADSPERDRPSSGE
ncbi:MAG: hypothetical protein SFU56_15665 [Capsulimonadales bacterium]|nr:hypothetical protein [Capsulimonadales bacterium]